MKRQFSHITRQLYRLVSSSGFFYTCLGLFVLAALWVATTSLYPMAFDEDFHLGLIKIYAQHVLPYGIEKTTDMSTYGAATSDPSYFFHWLMSWPYRLLHGVGWSETAIVIALRILNIGFVAGAMMLYRRVLLKLGLSGATTHVVMALFLLIPIMPMLAGQINYDNLLLLIIGCCLVYTLRIGQVIKSGRPMPLQDLGLLLILCLFGAATKYAFLPVAAGIALWLGILLLKNGKKTAVRLLNATARTIGDISPLRMALISLGIIAGFFFAAKYVVNYAQYGSFIPSCDKVFTKTECQAYGPWARNYRLKHDLPSDFQPKSFPEYMAEDWVPGMTFRLFFSVAGPTNTFQTLAPLVVPIVVFSTLVGIGCLCVIARWRTVMRRYPFLWLVVSIAAIYMGALAIQLYKSYVTTAQPVAINGRYLLPLVPLAGALLIAGWQSVVRRRVVSTSLAAVVLVLLFVEGGGLITYAVQSEQSWFWPGWGQDSHRLIQDTLSPIEPKF